jgi:threonine/homoserine/homoserine lactone efflux protein
MDQSLLAFVAVAAVVIVTPGQDTALTVRNTLLGGRPAGVGTAFGVAGGQAVWTVAASLGLTAVLVASEPVFVAVRLVGAAYLVYLGAVALRAAWRGSPMRLGAVTTAEDVPTPGLPPGRAWRHGLFSSLSNPKLAIFFSSLLPQWVPAGAAPLPTMLGLGAVFVGMTVAWLALYATIVDRAGDRLRRGRIRRALDAVTGTILVALGLRLATESRPL